MRQIIFLNEISVDAKIKIEELSLQIEKIKNSQLLTSSQKKTRIRDILREIRKLRSGSSSKQD